MFKTITDNEILLKDVSRSVLPRVVYTENFKEVGGLLKIIKKGIGKQRKESNQSDDTDVIREKNGQFKIITKQ